ncbi:MAG: glycosyltransferase, partial [Nevskiales bacterium]
MAAGIVAGLSAIGVVQVVAGWAAVRRFAARAASTPMAGAWPATTTEPITVLKPLHGDEPLLEAALASICRQDYPQWQVVFGVQDPADTALPAVRRLQARFPGCDIALVVDPIEHGPNRKVANLINMLPAARHDVLVIADSDLHVPPDYLRRLAAALEP